MRRIGTLTDCWWECKIIQLFRTVLDSFLKKVKNSPIIWPSHSTLGDLPKKDESTRPTKACMWISIAALFVITENNPKVSPLVHKQCIAHPHYIKHYPLMTRNKHTKTQMKRKIIMLSERNQTKKKYILYNSSYKNFQNVQTNLSQKKTDQWLPGAGRWREPEGEITKGASGNFAGRGAVWGSLCWLQWWFHRYVCK